jgi:ABC-type branched-subunit amino acid transport system substrate-binding protein
MSPSGKVFHNPGRKHWMFQSTPSDYMVIDRVLENMEERGFRRIAMFQPTKLQKYAPFSYLMKRLKEKALRVTVVQTYGIDPKMSFKAKKDYFGSKLSRIKGTQPQAVIFYTNNIGETSAAAAGAWQNEFRPGIEFYTVPEILVQSSRDFPGGDHDLAITAVPSLLVPEMIRENKEQLRQIERYKEYYGGQVETAGGVAYDAARIVIHAVETSGTDRANIRNGIETTNKFPGIMGKYNFSYDDHNGLSSREALTVVQSVKREAEKPCDDSLFRFPPDYVCKKVGN